MSRAGHEKPPEGNIRAVTDDPWKRAFTVVAADSDGAVARLLREAFGEGDATIVAVQDASHALQALDECAADLLVADSGLSEKDSLDLLRAAQQRWPGMPVVLITGRGAVGDIAEAIGAGASDLLMHPVSVGQLAFAVQKGLLVARRSVAASPPPSGDANIVFGRSAAMGALRDLLKQVAPTSSTVLVRGESGTGKELVSRALHTLSPRADRPFIKIDCTSLPETLIESELFGYEKGAFTGASGQKMGRVQLADGGTLFLDEIGDLALPLQAKLLRLLQDREFERLGGKTTIRVDLRVVAATHRDLETMVEQGTFRQDLFWRLNVVPVWIAPLRARRGDIDELAKHFCEQAALESGKPGTGLSDEALLVLSSQRWPGNVRQLQNFVARLVVFCKGSRISKADVESELARPVSFATETGPAGGDAAGVPVTHTGLVPLDETVRAAERKALTMALKEAGGKRSAAARLLGVSRSTLYAKLQEYGLL